MGGGVHRDKLVILDNSSDLKMGRNWLTLTVDEQTQFEQKDGSFVSEREEGFIDLPDTTRAFEKRLAREQHRCDAFGRHLRKRQEKYPDG